MWKRAAHIATAAAADLKKSVRDEVKLEFAGLKTTTVASRGSLAAKVAAKVGDRDAENRGVKSQARILGIDQTAGKQYRRKTSKGDNTRAERITKVNRNLNRPGVSWARAIGCRWCGELEESQRQCLELRFMAPTLQCFGGCAVPLLGFPLVEETVPMWQQCWLCIARMTQQGGLCWDPSIGMQKKSGPSVTQDLETEST